MKSKFLSALNNSALLLLIILVSAAAAKAQTINTTLTACKSTANTLDFDIYIENATNLSASDFILQSEAYGIDLNYAAISNRGTISIEYLKGSTELNSNFTNFTPINCSLNPTSKSIRINAQLVTNISNGTPLPKGKLIRAGTFRLTNTAHWTPNSKPEFRWVIAQAPNKTQTKFSVYMNGATTGSKCLPTETNVKVDITCNTIILNADNKK